MVLTLIQTSQNRKLELIRFINSLNSQINIDFSQIQLIFIDQGENKDIFEVLNPQILLTYIKVSPCSLSYARNLGLKYVEGIYVGFPDDDCWYESDTISKVINSLAKYKINGIVGVSKDENNINTAKYLNKETLLTHKNAFSAISYTMFFYYNSEMRFDENMGVGSPYNLGSGEETDYMLYLIENYNYKILFSPSLIIHHPKFNSLPNDILLNKSYSYARGTGYLMHKHNFPWGYYIKNFIRPLLGMIIFALEFNFYKSKRSFLLFKGRLEGFFYRIDQVDKQ